MYNHEENMKEAVARRAINNWPELQRAVYAERRAAPARLTIGQALSQYFARFAADNQQHPLEDSFNRMLNFALGKG